MIATLLLLAPSPATVQGPPRDPEADEPRGLLRRTEDATPGYTLFAPLRSKSTYLVDEAGEVAHQWTSDGPPGQSVYVLPNGNLLRCERAENDVFRGGGQGGRVREYDWDGEVVWEYVCSDDTRLHHHDVEPLPNGNLLLIAWELVPEEEALAAGRDPRQLTAGALWPDMVLEVKPSRPEGGQVVWEWHAWDHLVQDRDPELANHGEIAAHPHRIDVNATPRAPQPTAAELAELERLRQLGYVGDEEEEEDGRDHGGPSGRGADWLHCNSIDYSPELDVIVVGSRELSELWFIDHSTTTEEARGSTGGRYGRGGDLLFRWGNPRWSDGAGERTLFGQHDAQWIPPGFPGAGNLLVFNNGERGAREESTVDELRMKLDAESLADGFSPEHGVVVERVASYPSPDFCSHISGAQRLPSGNTLICAGETGRVIELTPELEVVWEYLNPHGGDVGRGAPGGPAHRGEQPDRGERPERAEGGPRGGRGGAGSPMALFRATRLAPDHPGLTRLAD